MEYEKDLKEDTTDVVSKKTLSIVSEISEKDDYTKFRDWMFKNAPYCDNPKNFSSSRITEEEFKNLKESFTGLQIAETIMQIENRKDLRKKYTNLYRTVLNWIKPEGSGISVGKTKYQLAAEKAASREHLEKLADEILRNS